jgi:hypothetical protein
MALTDTVQSGFRRGFLNNKRCLSETIRGKRITFKGECDALLYLAREAEMHSTFLNSELTTLSSQYFRVVDFSDLAHYPGNYSGPLATFLGMGEQLATRLHDKMAATFKGSRSHGTRKLLNPEHEAQLRWLFSPMRELRWPLLSSGEFDLLNLHELGINSQQTGEAEFGYQCSNMEWGLRTPDK